MRKRFLVLALVALCFVAATSVWPEENHLNIAQRFGGDKVTWSIDGNLPYVVHYPVSIIISARATIPAGRYSTVVGHYLPKPFKGAPVVQATIYYGSFGMDYVTLPTIAVRTISDQAIILIVTRPNPSDLAQPCDVRYFLQLTGEY